MRYVAAFLALCALVILAVFVPNVNGSTAILFSFVGMPAMALALLLYFIDRWREGAFTLPSPPPPKTERS